MLRQVESGIPADSRCCCPLLSVKCLLLCSSIFIFPRMAALTFSTEKLTVFRDSQGSAVLLCPVRKRCHERKVMSVPPGCLLNLRRHYFTTQHDCIHIIPHPTKVASTPFAWWPCASGPWRAGFNQRDRDPSAFSFDGQSNKAQSSMTHQSARVRAEGERRWLLQCWRRGANSRFRPPTQQRLTDLCPHTPALSEVTRGIAALISGEDDNGCVVVVWPPITDKKLNPAERWRSPQSEVMVSVWLCSHDMSVSWLWVWSWFWSYSGFDVYVKHRVTELHDDVVFYVLNSSQGNGGKMARMINFSVYKLKEDELWTASLLLEICRSGKAFQLGSLMGFNRSEWEKDRCVLSLYLNSAVPHMCEYAIGCCVSCTGFHEFFFNFLILILFTYSL